MRPPRQAAPVIAKSSGMVWASQTFLLSLLIPFFLPVGSLVLMPHRILLLVLFIPLFSMLFVQRRAGPVLAIDWLLLGSALWVGAALLANHPVSLVIEPFGIHVVEFFGAYLLARVSIRSAEDFHSVVRLFFMIVMFLLPFAAIEAVTRRPILLEILPNTNVRPVNTGIRLGMRRAQTVFAHPILFGVFVSAGLGLFWYALRPRGLRFIAAPAVALATLFSLSTGALIALVIQSLLIGWEIIFKTIRSRWKLFTILVVIGYLAVDLLSNRSPFHVLVTYASFTQGSAYNRILVFQFGMDNVWTNPMFGLGLNDWVRPRWMSGSMDNFWLLIAVKYGLPSFLMLAVALFLILRRMSKLTLVYELDWMSRAGYLTMFGGILIAGGTVHFWHAIMAFILFAIGSGVWLISGGVAPEDKGGNVEPAEPERRSPYTRQPGFGRPIRSGSAAEVRAGGSTNRPIRRRVAPSAKQKEISPRQTR